MDHVRSGDLVALLHENGLGYTLTSMETDKPHEGRQPLLKQMLTFRNDIVDIQDAFHSPQSGKQIKFSGIFHVSKKYSNE